MKTFKGNGCADGIGIGKVVIKCNHQVEYTLDLVDNAEEEVKLLNQEIRELINQIDSLYEKTCVQSGEEAAELLETYQMILSDKSFFNPIFDRIKNKRLNRKMAIKMEVEEYHDKFMSIEDPYMKERFNDIRDICRELVMVCDSGHAAMPSMGITEPSIIIADNLTPVDTVKFDKKFLRGFVTEEGGTTSHSVILAKTIGIPAIVGAKGVLDAAENGCVALVSGYSGEIIIDPSQEEKKRFESMEEQERNQKKKFESQLNKKTITTDGICVKLMVNSGDADTMALINPDECCGIGLFRSEFLYMQQQYYPDEDVQFEAYRNAGIKMKDNEVIIRTLDIGGDKALDYMNLEHEDNPFLGYRAVRICLDRQDMFKTQLRAILRASAYGKIKIMFPMIVCVEELEKCKEILEEAKSELRLEEIPFNDSIPVGIMVETPAAVMVLEQLARMVDFFSVGTNDLVQYITASDRGNRKLQYLYNPCHISVLRTLMRIGEVCKEYNVEWGVCGETASSSIMIPFLLGCGVNELSVAPSAIGRVNYMLRHLSQDECRQKAEYITTLKHAEEACKQLELLSQKALS